MEAARITKLLLDWRNGDQAALDRLTPLVYDELRRLARGFLRNERSGHTLQATALVHESFLKLFDQSQLNWQSRAHFLGVAAQVMRHVLVDYARKHTAGKRGNGVRVISLDEATVVSTETADHLIELDRALQALAAFDPRKSRIIELRYFGGLTIEETAEVTGLAAITVRRDMAFAEAWLQRELKGSPE